MRLDKFLQVARLVKRRTVANELCDAGRVQRNGQVARASSPVSAGDVLQLDYGPRTLKVIVRDVPTGNMDRARATELYEIIAQDPRTPE